MAQTPSGDRMHALYHPPTFISAPHPVPPIPASAAPLTTHLNIAQSSSSPSSHFGLPRPSGILNGHATSNATGLSTTPSLPSLSPRLGSPSTESSQTINLSQNSTLSYAGPLRCEAPAVLTTPSQAVGGNMVNIILPDVPMYHPLFLQWLHARRGWITGQGCTDPLLVGPSFLAQMFDGWLQHWWPLFHILRIGAPDTNPSSWVGIFDFWFVTLSTEHTSPPSMLQTTPPDACAASTVPHQAPDLAIPRTPSASRSKKHYRNEMSALTVQQIQHACTVAGGDADAIQRLAVVFPPGGVTTRDALKVGRKPRMDHRGYQEFSVLVDGWWYCRLCNILGRPKWKNEKDILNHVWNEHCDPPPSR